MSGILEAREYRFAVVFRQGQGGMVGLLCAAFRYFVPICRMPDHTIAGWIASVDAAALPVYGVRVIIACIISRLYCSSAGG